MPVAEGLSCLQKIKSDKDIARIPLVLFSADKDQTLLSQVYSNGSNTFVVKPKEDEELKSILRLTLDYWGRMGVLPDGPGPVKE